MTNSPSKGTALITGASRGIGGVYADRGDRSRRIHADHHGRLAKRGYDLILVARSEARLKTLFARLTSETGRSVTPLPTDPPIAGAAVHTVQQHVRSDLLLEEQVWAVQPRLACQAEFPKSSVENAARFGLPAAGWTLFGAVARPKSRGHLRLTGPNPLDPIQIEANSLCHPDDLKAAIACVELCREIGNSAALRPFVKREVMPGNLKGPELENFVRDAAVTYWHQTCTAKMGRDSMSVVNGNLKVYGIENLRIADGSIMPRVTTGNTMAPCIIIGERAAEVMRVAHKL